MSDSDENTDDEPAEPDADELTEGITGGQPDDVDPEELAEQEWTLGGEPDQEVIQFKGMKFLVEDPDDDAVLNMMAEAEMGEGDTSERMFQLVSSAVVEPEVTPERWRDLRMSERIGLMVRVSEAIGLADMMDFPEGGQSPQQA